MKLSVPALLLFATVSLVAADPVPADPAADKPRLPAAAVEKLNEGLPRFTPTPAPEPRKEFGPAPGTTRTAIREQSVARAPADELEAEPEVLELPKMTVKQQPRPRVRLGEATILGPRAFNEELAKKNLSGLDRALNKFTLPLFGSGAAERAREDYDLARKNQFMSDVLTIAKAAEQTDPAAAKALVEAAAKP